MFVRATAIVFLLGLFLSHAADEKVINKRDAEGVEYTDRLFSSNDNEEVDTPATPAQPAPSPLQTSMWCRLPNSSFVAKDQAFMLDSCTVCRCLAIRRILCQKLSCMQSFCVDGSSAQIPTGQCCPRCAYENGPSSCIYKNLSIPHGAVVSQSSNNVQCWCQFGAIECRQVANGDSTFFGDSTTVYVVVIVVCLLILIGTLLCGGCSLLAYYYYRQNQTTAQSAVEQYWNNAGWQPMEDGETPAADKQVEAQQVVDVNQYPHGHAAEFVPPPYAIYNGAYASEEKQN